MVGAHSTSCKWANTASMVTNGRCTQHLMQMGQHRIYGNNHVVGAHSTSCKWVNTASTVTIRSVHTAPHANGVQRRIYSNECGRCTQHLMQMGQHLIYGNLVSMHTAPHANGIQRHIYNTLGQCIQHLVDNLLPPG